MTTRPREGPGCSCGGRLRGGFMGDEVEELTVGLCGFSAISAEESTITGTAAAIGTIMLEDSIAWV